MAETYDVSIKVISQKGECIAQHKVGDEWVIKGDLKAARICIAAYNAVHPYVMALMVGGSFPWETDPDMTRVACPDPDNPLILELRRLTK